MAFVVGASSSGEYDKGQFDRQPDSRWEGPIPPVATVDLGGWTKNDVMQFRIVPEQGWIEKVEGGSNVAIFLTRDRSNQGQYFEVNTGSDSRIGDWSITFDVYASIQPDVPPVGQWMFTKGKSDDDKTR